MDLERTEKFIHSDTLFSALCRISDVYLGKPSYKEFISPFIKKNPPFIMSSLFPYLEDTDKTIYFFPKPYIFKDFVEKFPENIKTFKKIQFISKELFDAYLRGDDQFLEEQFQDSNGTLQKDNLIQGDRVWMSSSERNIIPEIDFMWSEQQEPRVAIDRITKDTSIFHYSRIHFHKKAGLYLLIKPIGNEDNKEGLNKLFIRLRYLGDTGLGGERSSGCGQFEVKLDGDGNPFSLELESPRTPSKNFITLSLFLPREQEIKQGLINSESYYEIVNRRGWISNFSYLRKSIKMLSEGSVLHRVREGEEDSHIYGKIENITPEILKNENPDYKIHRYGYGYPIYF
jgi:CRISPR-associated protein Csm4